MNNNEIVKLLLHVLSIVTFFCWDDPCPDKGGVFLICDGAGLFLFAAMYKSGCALGHGVDKLSGLVLNRPMQE